MRDWHQHRRERWAAWHAAQLAANEAWVRRHGHRRSLQRRLFRWFGAAMVVSGFVVFVLLQWLGGSPTGMRDDQRIRSFAQNRVRDAWPSQAAIVRLTNEISDELSLTVRVVNSDGSERYRRGPACNGHAFHLAITGGSDGKQPLGDVEICRDRASLGAAGRFALVPLAAVLVLWLASVNIARRLGRPLDRLARVAADIGRGKLEQRYYPRRRDTEEVRVLGEALNEMAQRIGKQLTDQRALLATVSHELRSPLARMRVLIELLTDHQGASTELAQLDDEVKQVDQLVGDLLASARTDFGAAPWRRVDLTQIALEAFEQLGIDPTKLEVTTPDGHAVLDGDTTLLSRAVHNLLTNAVRHGGGVAALKIGTDGDGLRIEVEDDGPGIPAGEEARIFEPFFRASTHTENGGASVGLGLSLVRRIAEAHGGRVFAERRQPRGSRIGFSVRRQRPAAGQA